jgi:hypothetical protein
MKLLDHKEKISKKINEGESIFIPSPSLLDQAIGILRN